MRLGMLIDLKMCAACYSCAVKCKQEHFLPPGIIFSLVRSTVVCLILLLTFSKDFVMYLERK